MIRIILILFVVLIPYALHTNYHFTHINTAQAHQQTSTNVLYFENQFDAIKSQIDYVNRALTTNSTQNYEFLISRTQQILAGVNKIQNTLVQYNLTITLDQKICPKLTTFNRSELRRYISYTEIRQQLMVDFLATCLTCQFITNDVYKIRNLTKTYILHLNSTLDGKYCNQNLVSGQKAVGMVNLNLSYFKSNLNAKNWYYGSTTASDYKIYIFKLSSTYNLTNCPIETPYIKENEQICFNCRKGSMFNLGNQQCDQCKPNQILNTQTASCSICLGDKVLQGQSLVCKLCMISQGYLFNETRGECQKCDEKSYIDYANKKCVTINCPSNAPKFNRLNNQCQPCQLSQIIDPNNVTQCIKTNYIGLCHPETPLYDATQHICKACPANNIYSQNTNQCTPIVRSHFTYVQSMHSQVANITNVTVTCTPDKPKYNPSTKLCQPCQQGLQYNKKKDECFKPLTCSDTQIPDQDNLNCIKTSSTCLSNQVYILKINRCVPKSITCSSDQFYSQENHTCVEISSSCKKTQYYDTKLKVCKGISSRCAGNEIFNKNLSICEKLVLCKDNQHYDQELKICQKKELKCKDDQFYDQSANRCKKYQQITSPFAKNLIISGSYNGYLAEYNKLMQNNGSSMIDCQQSTPFYQKSSAKCISCPENLPYFNLQENKCVTCSSDQIYDLITHKCIGKKSYSQPLPSRISETISRITI